MVGDEYCETFNVRCPGELLNGEIFYRLREAQCGLSNGALNTT